MAYIIYYRNPPILCDAIIYKDVCGRKYLSTILQKKREIFGFFFWKIEKEDRLGVLKRKIGF